MRRKAYIAAVGGIFVLLGAGYAWSRAVTASSSEGLMLDEGKLYEVAYVVDGDTFGLRAAPGRDRAIRVRMLGIDTPETVDPRKAVGCYGSEASAEAHALLDGRSVRVAFSPNRELKDKYGRYLAYAYRDDGMFVNESLLSGGFAREYTVGRAYSLQKEFRALESEARKERRGLWSACAGAAQGAAR